jgi:hypothetical protein
MQRKAVMKNSVEMANQESVVETGHRKPASSLVERAASSPRAVLAFSALAATAWIRERFQELWKRAWKHTPTGRGTVGRPAVDPDTTNGGDAPFFADFAKDGIPDCRQHQTLRVTDFETTDISLSHNHLSEAGLYRVRK